DFSTTQDNIIEQIIELLALIEEYIYKFIFGFDDINKLKQLDTIYTQLVGNYIDVFYDIILWDTCIKNLSLCCDIFYKLYELKGIDKKLIRIFNKIITY